MKDLQHFAIKQTTHLNMINLVGWASCPPLFRELKKINYPILWGEYVVFPMDWAGETPTPQERIGYFLFVSALSNLDEMSCKSIYSFASFTELNS